MSLQTVTDVLLTIAASLENIEKQLRKIAANTYTDEGDE